MPDLNGKTYVITGASSGIGEATAEALVSAGANVMLGARREERLKDLADRLGERAAYRVCDVTRRGDVGALAEGAANAFGRVDGVINNAGIMPLSTIRKGRVDEWDQMIDVNIKGVMYGIHAVLNRLIEQGGGDIVNVSSVAGHVTGPGFAVYSGTKWAVRAISDGLRQEVGSKGVRVTIISPGAVATELVHSIKDEKTKEAMTSQSSFTPIASEDIANAITYALSQPAGVSVNEILVRPTDQQM